MTRELTCVVCPAGCRITVEMDADGTITSITGNTCPRGKNYAENEVTHPVRTLTSTVSIDTEEGTKLIPVKTDRPIPKEKLFEAMEIVKSIRIKAPYKVGDVICPDFIEQGTNLVACKEFDK